MSFAEDLQRFAVTVKARNQTVFVNTCAAAKDSIVIGSPVTGAPGQPVLTGALRASWQLEFESDTSALIATDLPYAPDNEEGVRQQDGRPYTQHSSVGGRHSVALTRAGIQALVDSETLKAGGESRA